MHCSKHIGNGEKRGWYVAKSGLEIKEGLLTTSSRPVRRKYNQKKRSGDSSLLSQALDECQHFSMVPKRREKAQERLEVYLLTAHVVTPGVSVQVIRVHNIAVVKETVPFPVLDLPLVESDQEVQM